MVEVIEYKKLKNVHAFIQCKNNKTPRYIQQLFACLIYKLFNVKHFGWTQTGCALMVERIFIFAKTMQEKGPILLYFLHPRMMSNSK
jgi:hypothetical protein